MYFTVHPKTFTVFLFQVYSGFGISHSVVSHQFHMTNVISAFRWDASGNNRPCNSPDFGFNIIDINIVRMV